MLAVAIRKINAIFMQKKSVIINITKILIAAGLLVFLIGYVKPARIAETFLHANYFYISLAVALSFFNVLLQYLKWKELCFSMLEVKDKKSIWYSLFYGFSAGITTPFRAGEYFGRAIPLKNTSMVKVTLATAIDKLFPMFFLLFTGSVASILFLKKYYAIPEFMVWSLILLTVILYTILLNLMNNRTFWKNFIFKKIKRIGFLSKQIEKLNVITRLNSQTTTRLSFFSLLFIITYTLQFTLLVLAFSPQSEFIYFFWASNLVMFTKSIIPPITFGELGIREGVALFFFGAMGAADGAIFDASMILFTINLVLPSVIGLFLLTKKS